MFFVLGRLRETIRTCFLREAHWVKIVNRHFENTHILPNKVCSSGKWFWIWEMISRKIRAQVCNSRRVVCRGPFGRNLFQVFSPDLSALLGNGAANWVVLHGMWNSWICCPIFMRTSSPLVEMLYSCWNMFSCLVTIAPASLLWLLAHETMHVLMSRTRQHLHGWHPLLA